MDAFPEAATDPAIHARQVAAQRLSHRCAQLADLTTTPSLDVVQETLLEILRFGGALGLHITVGLTLADHTP